jgi:hypothetical protein
VSATALRAAALVAAAAAATHPVQARANGGGGGSPLFGAWCGPADLEILYMEPGRFVAGEQTICDWRDPPGPAPRHATTIRCRTYYPSDGGFVAAHPRELAFDATVLPDGRMRLRLGEDPPVLLEPCHG